jgi:transposase
MKRFIEGADRTQAMLLPECVEDYVGPDNPVRVVEAFVEQLDLRAMGFEGSDPQVTGRPAYHPSVLLKIYNRHYPAGAENTDLQQPCTRTLRQAGLYLCDSR